MSSTRISMLTHAFYPRVGGAETLILALIPALAARGFEVDVVTRRYSGMAPTEVVRGAQVYRTPTLGPRFTASLGFTVAGLLHLLRGRRRPSILHAHHLLSPTTTAVLGKLLTGARVVVTVHGLGADLHMLRAARLGGLRMRLFTHLVDAFVAVSDEILDELRVLGVPDEKLVRIRNGVATDRFAPLNHHRRTQVRHELGFEGRSVALFVGRVEPVKNLGTLLDAWPTVYAALPEALLVVVGDGSQRAELEARGVRNVRFVGAQDPLPYFQAADCFVLPSWSEGLSVALLEAMACQLPSVVSAVGGSVELVRPGREGWVVAPDDAPAMAAALVEALGTREGDLAGRAARARVVASYSIDSTAEQLAAVYDRVLGREPVQEEAAA